VVDADGRVLAEASRKDADLLELVGVAPADGPGDRLEDADGLLAVALAITPTVRERAIAVERHADDGLLLQLAPEGVARLGDASQLEEKMQALAVLFARVDDRCIERIDVRVPDSPTIVRVDACAGPAPTTTTTAFVVDPAVTAAPTTAPESAVPVTSVATPQASTTAAPSTAVAPTTAATGTP
jgi:hypothetical protein